MEYTINKLATLSGVSTRTLRYYDEIGLLKPKCIRSNGYRIYAQEQVDALQQILFYREMGVSLEEIKHIILSPDFDREQALRTHLIALTKQKKHIESLITNVNKTLDSIKGGTIMTNSEKFQGLKDNYIKENEEKYGEETRTKYGNDAMDESNNRIKNMSEKDWQHQKDLENQIADLLKAALKKGNPECDEAQKACDLHRQWICMFWKSGTYSKQAHKGLAQMYVADERFKKYYEDIGAGCADFFKNAIEIYCK